jgi:predicted ferric reductase
MYRDFWRLHLLAIIVFFGALGAAWQAGTHGQGVKATMWVLAAVACVGVLVAPLFIESYAKRHSGPPGRHGDASDKH